MEAMKQTFIISCSKRPIYRPIPDPYLTDTSPAGDRYISADASVDSISVDNQSNVGQLSSDSRLRVGR